MPGRRDSSVDDRWSTTAPSGSKQLVGNPGFESGTFSPWAIGGWAPTPVITTTTVHTGSYSALLGATSGTEPSGNSAVKQTISIPSGASAATLSFWYWPSSADTIADDWQTA